MLANTHVQLRRAINVIIDAILMSILHETTRKKDWKNYSTQRAHFGWYHLKTAYVLLESEVGRTNSKLGRTLWSQKSPSLLISQVERLLPTIFLAFQFQTVLSNLRLPNYKDAVKMLTIFCWLNYCWHNPEKHLLTTVLTFGTCVEFVVTNLIENVRFWGNGSEYDELLKSMCPRHLFDEHFQSFPL